MISIQVSTKKFSEVPAQGYAFFLEEDFSFSQELKALAQEYFPSLEDFFKERGFRGAQNSAVVLPVLKDKKIVHLIFVGLGSKEDKHLYFEYYRRAVGKIIRAAESHKLTSTAVSLPSASVFGVTKEYLAQQTATIIHMAGYHYDEFKRERLSTIKREITLCVSAAEQKSFSQAVASGEVIAEAVNTARQWIDAPPSNLTPTILAELAEKVAKESGLKLTVFNESEVTKMGMGGIAAVAAGSEQDAKLIILEHKVSQKKPTIAFVGKGITFDSGGLSLKPANSMETMKEDMAGASSVINAIGALGKLKADVNIVAIAPTTENLPSGTATKPGDVIRFYNGVTAEVRNTDAEGRLVLADGLSYAVDKYKPDFIIDLATLTGACDYAVGPFYSGMLSQNEEMASRVLAASQTSGDRIWRLPMHNDYEAAIKSNVADISNIGKSNYKAGTITATFFLKHFVGKTPWVHLDIASNAFAVPAISYYESGATGVGVRLLVDLALNWK